MSSGISKDKQAEMQEVQASLFQGKSLGGDMQIKKELVRNQACFSQFTDEEVAMLASILVEKRFTAGQTIVLEGDPVDCVYLIVSGLADVKRLVYQNGKAETIQVAILGSKPNDSIGLNETGFYSLTGRRTATVIAQTDMVLLCLTLPLFHGFALTYSHVNEVMRKQAETLKK